MKVEAVHRADGLRPHVDLLRRHTVSNHYAGLVGSAFAFPIIQRRFRRSVPDLANTVTERGRGCSPRQSRNRTEDTTRRGAALTNLHESIRERKPPVCFHHTGETCIIGAQHKSEGPTAHILAFSGYTLV